MKKIPFLLLETLIIIFLLSILVYFGINKYNSLFNDFPKYTVKFNDINGLEIGSPVRLAGVRIGHVVKQQLKGNKVSVTFKVVNKEAKIPKGAIAGIESSGLGGSKSLEIYPPTSKVQEGPLLQPVEPLRIDSLKEIINILSEASLDFSRTIYSFLNENAENAGAKLKNALKYLRQKSFRLQNSQQKIEESGKTAAEKTKIIKELVKETSDNIDTVRKNMSNLATSEEVKSGIHQLKETTENLADFVENGKAQQKLEELNVKVKNFNKKAKQLNEKVSKIKDRELDYIIEFNNSVKKIAEKMQKLVDSYEEKSASE